MDKWRKYGYLLTPANEVWGKVICLQVCVCPQGGSASGGAFSGGVPGPRGCLLLGGAWCMGVSALGGCLVGGGCLVPGMGAWSQGVSAPGGMSGPGGCLVWGVSALGGVPGGRGVPGPGGICSWGVPGPGGVPGGDIPRAATAAGSTHPTGMHSCNLLFMELLLDKES